MYVTQVLGLACIVAIVVSLFVWYWVSMWIGIFVLVILGMAIRAVALFVHIKGSEAIDRMFSDMFRNN